MLNNTLFTTDKVYKLNAFDIDQLMWKVVYSAWDKEGHLPPPSERRWRRNKEGFRCASYLQVLGENKPCPVRDAGADYSRPACQKITFIDDDYHYNNTFTSVKHSATATRTRTSAAGWHHRVLERWIGK